MQWCSGPIFCTLIAPILLCLAVCVVFDGDPLRPGVGFFADLHAPHSPRGLVMGQSRVHAYRGAPLQAHGM
jgi:hypothetical protein